MNARGHQKVRSRRELKIQSIKLLFFISDIIAYEKIDVNLELAFCLHEQIYYILAFLLCYMLGTVLSLFLKFFLNAWCIILMFDRLPKKVLTNNHDIERKLVKYLKKFSIKNVSTYTVK